MLLQEFNPVFKLQVISEGRRGTSRTKLCGIFQRADEFNKNKRRYKKDLLERERGKMHELIKENRLVGELDHPNYDVVKLQNASHRITKLSWKGNDLIGEMELLSTPAGRVAECLINDGVQLGISSRALGSLTPCDEGEGFTDVNDDLDMRTYDLVADPSVQGAFPGITESVQREDKISGAYKKVLGERAFIALLKEELQGLSEDELEEFSLDPRRVAMGAANLAGRSKRVARKVGSGVGTGVGIAKSLKRKGVTGFVAGKDALGRAYRSGEKGLGPGATSFAQRDAAKEKDPAGYTASRDRAAGDSQEDRIKSMRRSSASTRGARTRQANQKEEERENLAAIARRAAETEAAKSREDSGFSGSNRLSLLLAQRRVARGGRLPRQGGSGPISYTGTQSDTRRGSASLSPKDLQRATATRRLIKQQQDKLNAGYSPGLSDLIKQTNEVTLDVSKPKKRSRFEIIHGVFRSRKRAADNPAQAKPSDWTNSGERKKPKTPQDTTAKPKGKTAKAKAEAEANFKALQARSKMNPPSRSGDDPDPTVTAVVRDLGARGDVGDPSASMHGDKDKKDKKK